MCVQSGIEKKLIENLNTSHLEVINESNNHNVPACSESHFKLVMVSDDFEGKNLLARHRLVNKILEDELKNKINAFATSELEMIPTVRNIFKIICNDVDVFFNEMRKTSVSAQNHHNEPVNYSKINNERKKVPEKKKHEKTNIDAFPLYINKTIQDY